MIKDPGEEIVLTGTSLRAQATPKGRPAVCADHGDCECHNGRIVQRSKQSDDWHPYADGYCPDPWTFGRSKTKERRGAEHQTNTDAGIVPGRLRIDPGDHEADRVRSCEE